MAGREAATAVGEDEEGGALAAGVGEEGGGSNGWGGRGGRLQRWESPAAPFALDVIAVSFLRRR